ncbi:hypothetical protein A2U01_0055148, partial [Trifolium medium]|nr:hypothetical protein [Trifolium medium]
MTVSKYAAKFEDLCHFAPHYNTMEAEEDKFNKSRICDKDSKSKANYYKAANEKRGKDFGRGKPYGRGGKKPDEGGSSGGRGG